eukprot:CAMPEP_0194099472 /NCGR_PEP_ID=MMETSP0150-20130528/644_1 /TAXON_ID=122233 /ORGANISM="Chaetoceros debilis, Strain MM31A-1" /LENGTH=338 /DNA_ID=CAMNT_0038785683 /DNA_START=122 /DNA_END=1135 /DNA_ORIENTATION=+
MKLLIYHGLDDEEVPKDVTHVIVDNSVTVIKAFAFNGCKLLVSVIMYDNVKRIEGQAFSGCIALRFIRFSKTLVYIGMHAFGHCYSLKALFLPSTLKYIEDQAFIHCRSMRVLILPNAIDLGNIGYNIIDGTAIHQIVRNAGVEYHAGVVDANGIDHFARCVGVGGVEYSAGVGGANNESIRRIRRVNNLQVNEWLVHHMDEAPLHKICYNSFVSTKHINDYLTEHGNDTALQIDTIHGMTPLHILSMNPHAPSDTIAALLNSNMEASMCLDTNQHKTPLEYAREYNVEGLMTMITILCNHRNYSSTSNLVEITTTSTSTSAKTRFDNHWTKRSRRRI